MRVKGKLIFLHLARTLGAFAVSRWLTRRSGRILCYHGGRLGDEHLFNGKLFCPQELLEQRLEWMAAKRFVPTTLDALADGATLASSTGISVVVTFDDGWYSTGARLLPVLAQRGYRPVLYLHTAAFLSGAPLASVVLRYILWKSSTDAATLSGFAPELDGYYRLDVPAERERLLARAQSWLATQDAGAETQVAALERLAGTMGVTAADVDLSSRRFSYMNREELLAAAEQGCTIELHGHVHRYVRGGDAENRADIETCRAHILALGLPPPRHYCYPSGAHDANAVQTMTAIGVETATTCIPGLVPRVDNANRYFLPRFLDGTNVTMIEFEAEMSGLLEIVRSGARKLGLRPSL